MQQINNNTMEEIGYLRKIAGFQAFFDFTLILIFLFLILVFIWFAKVPLSQIMECINTSKKNEKIITHSIFANKEPDTDYRTEHELTFKAKGKKRPAPEMYQNEQPQHQETPLDGITTILSDLEQASKDSKNSFVSKFKCFVNKEKNKIKIKKNKKNLSDNSKLNALPLNTRNSTTVINYSETSNKTKKRAKKSPKKTAKNETIFEVVVTKKQTKSDIVLNELKRNQSNSTVKSNDYLSSIPFANALNKSVSNSTISFSESDLTNSNFLEKNRDKLLVINSSTTNYSNSLNSNHNQTLSHLSEETNWTTQTAFKNKSQLNINDNLNKRIETETNSSKLINNSSSSVQHIDDSGYATKSISSSDSSDLENKRSTNSNVNISKSKFSDESIMTTQTQFRTQEFKNVSKSKSDLKIYDNSYKKINETDPKNPKLINKSLFCSMPSIDDSDTSIKSIISNCSENSNHNQTLSHWSEETNWTTQTAFKNKSKININDTLKKRIETDANSPKLINNISNSVPHIDDSGYATKSLDNSFLENQSLSYISSTNSNVNITKSNFSNESIMTTQTQFRRLENKIPDLIKDLNEDFSLSQLIIPKRSQTNTLKDAQSFKSILSNISVSNNTASGSSLFSNGLNQKQTDLLRTFSNIYSCSNNSNKIFEFGSDNDFKFNIKYDLKSTDSNLNQKSRTESGFDNQVQGISKRPSGLKFNLLKQFVTPIKLKENNSTLSIDSSLKSCSLDYTSSAVSSSSDLSARNEFHPNVSLHSDTSVEELPEQTCFISITGNLVIE